MRCPHCGNVNLVWDYVRGEVVCPKCGTVVDNIYVDDRPTRTDLIYKPVKGKEIGLSKVTREYLTLLDGIKKNRRLSGKGFIDAKSFMEYVEGRRGKVGIIKVRLPSKSLKRNAALAKVLRIIRKYPRLNSRTERAKYALGLIAIHAVTKNSLSVEEISRATGLSGMHVRRLIKVALKSDAFLREVRDSLKPPHPVSGILNT